MKYLREFLSITPFSLAVWRAAEAYTLSQAFENYKPQGPILDIGCGFGEFMSVFRQKIDGHMIDVGIDISQDEINLATNKGVYKKLVCGDARDLSMLRTQFNCVTAISVLEHIKNVDKVFAEVCKILRPGGLFIYTVPTTKLDSLLWKGLLHRVFLHHSLYSPKAWVDKSTHIGLEVKMVANTLTPAQLSYFEYGLTTAMFTQISRKMINRRLPFSPRIRIEILERFAQAKLKDGIPTETNILVVAQKPF